MNLPSHFSCPFDCLPGVGQVFGGQYPLDFEMNEDPVILDIGANVGAFTLLCHHRWPSAFIHAYEPHPEVFPYLLQNVDCLPRVQCYNAAIGNPDTAIYLFEGENLLTSSLHRCGRQTERKLPVRVSDPRIMPLADLIKIDVEGAEEEIISRLRHFPAVMIVEWHSEGRRRAIEQTLSPRMNLLHCKVHGRGWGVSVYERNK